MKDAGRVTITMTHENMDKLNLVNDIHEVREYLARLTNAIIKSSLVPPELEKIITDAIQALKLSRRYLETGVQPESEMRTALLSDVDDVLARLFAYKPKWYTDPRIEERENGSGLQRDGDAVAADGSGG